MSKPKEILTSLSLKVMTDMSMELLFVGFVQLFSTCTATVHILRQHDGDVGLYQQFKTPCRKATDILDTDIKLSYLFSNKISIYCCQFLVVS